jgi:hypothetical protein
MNPMPGKCPVCSSTMAVTRLQCGQCGTGVDGMFAIGRLQALTPEQVQFVETFIKAKGKIKDVEAELGISYPTVVARLNEVVSAMGYEVDENDMSEVDEYELYEARVMSPKAPRIPAPPMSPGPAIPVLPPHAAGMPGAPKPGKISDHRRQQILDDLEKGKISADEAMRLLHGQ